MAYNEGADKINQDSPLSRIHRTTKEQIFFPQKVLLSTTEAAPLSEHDFENNLKKKGWRLSISSDNRKNSLSKSNQSSDLNTSNFVQVIVDQTRKPDPTVAICSTLAT